MNLQICQLNPEDHRAFYEIRLEGLGCYPWAFGTEASDWEKATETQVRSLLTASHDKFVMGAFIGGELVGSLGIQADRKQSVQHKATLWGFHVKTELRSTGIGAQLLTTVIAQISKCKEIDYVRVQATVDKDSYLIDTYESCQFSRYGVEVAAIKVGTKYFDQIYLRRDLPRLVMS